ncbi:Cytochrome [Candidatus Filomicrobium marinum]|uniref:nitrite reductase (cytochrome; ammonia-forming) n=1 Tax=Candidatus Filomicrobium marinum TaxID=1608628 RepID=A0A0D6JHM8_9HYPH|nr:cytochrome c3 family protein [Candidatus Filomicrobium marinum]CFX41807.1 Cytochrome [Candidatus Filomicrobium marinum]CPR21156.1 Cytochrome [Candidatus Filomicrobium marinum]
MSRTAKLWILWVVSTLVGGGILLAAMIYGGPLRASLLIGKTTSGHHQIELACEACHTSPFGGGEVLQEACLSCHKAELAAAKDSHPLKKFRDPRNADRLAKLNATQCVTCHREHKPDITGPMGVTQPGDYCELCHEKVGKDRPSHLNIGFDTCASAGCHNYHDNRALYEDFLEKHAGQQDVKELAIFKLRAEKNEPLEPREPLITIGVANAPADKLSDQKINNDWLATTHAQAGVNCAGCHAPDKKDAAEIADAWTDKPSTAVCTTCHAPEASSFTQGKHGMRLAKGMKSEVAGLFGIFRDKPLTPMQVSMARLPMSSKAHAEQLTCTSCHSAHTFAAVKAQVESCTSCHADEHTKAYERSAHYKLWQDEIAGVKPKGTGVSCATCHMPRQWVEDPATYSERIVANHNQNDNLRPNEKMIRSVCMECHGLGFSIDALADQNLIKRNFSGQPAVKVESIDWVKKRVEEREKAKASQ